MNAIVFTDHSRRCKISGMGCREHRDDYMQIARICGLNWVFFERTSFCGVLLSPQACLQIINSVMVRERPARALKPPALLVGRMLNVIGIMLTILCDEDPWGPAYYEIGFHNGSYYYYYLINYFFYLKIDILSRINRMVSHRIVNLCVCRYS